jgi:uncharacterized repeat protein (TIGR01451 family)
MLNALPSTEYQRGAFMRRFIVFAAVVLIASTAIATTRNVNNSVACSDVTGAPYCTINAAVIAATTVSGDTIQIGPGTYATAIAAFSKNLTFIGSGNGTAPASNTIITTKMTYTGSGAGTTIAPILSVQNLRSSITGSNTNLTVNGTGAFAGLTLTNVVFTGGNNHGLFIRQNGAVSNISVTGSTFQSHGQTGLLIQRGAGQVTSVDNVTISGSTFTLNGEYGIRIEPASTNMTMGTSSVTSNTIDGILFFSVNGLTLTDMTVTGNRFGVLLFPFASPDAINNVTLTNLNASNNTKFSLGAFGSGLSLSGGSGPVTNVTATGGTFSGNGLDGITTGGAVSGFSVDCATSETNTRDGFHENSSPSVQAKAEHIYWGCSTGPNTAGCSTVTGNVDYLPFRPTAASTCTPMTDLGVTKSDAPDPVSPGGTLTFTLVGTNHGPDPATGVTIIDTLPAGVTFSSASAGCVNNSGTVTCTLSNPLAMNATESFNIVVTVTQASGMITNTASITGNETDSVSVNNSATSTTAVGITNLGITKTDSPDPVSSGGTLTYTVVVTNSGPDASTGATITDALPAGVTFSSASPGCVNSSGTVTCTVGALANGGSQSFTITTTVTASSGTLSNTATIVANESDPVPANNSSTATTSVGVTNLGITKTDSPDPVSSGGTLTYTVVATNGGPDVSTGSTITDVLPAGVTFSSASPGCVNSSGTVTCTVGALANGGSQSFTITTTVTASSGTLSNTATIAANESDPVPANNSSTATTSVGITNLGITKTDSPDPVSSGGTLTYTLVATNSGPDVSTGATITDVLPAGVTFSSASPGCVNSSGTVTCTVGPMANGGSQSFTITTTVTASSGTLSNTATITANEFDPAAGNNSASASTTVVAAGNVPTLSGWELLALAAFLAMIGYVAVKR